MRSFGRFLAWVALGASFLLTAQSGRSQTGGRTTRVLVKLRASLGSQIEAQMTEGRPSVVRGQGGEAVTAFLQRHSGRRLAPVHPELLQARRRARQSEAQLAQAVRGRFGARAARTRGDLPTPELGRTHILEVEGGQDVPEVLDRLRRDPEVEYAEEDRLARVSLVPNDPYYSSLGSWGQAYDDLWGIKKIASATAWDTTAGDGVVVAVIDTGVDYTHPDIADNIWSNVDEIAGNGIDDDGNGFIDDVRGWDFIGASLNVPAQDNDPQDGHGHGTHVAGTIAAEGNNGIGVVGVAWRAKVMPVKGLHNSGSGWSSLLANAIVYAANNGADVINASWGGPGDSQVIADAIDYAYSLGVVVVVAAGNDNEDASLYYPARHPKAITVAATDRSDYKANFSNWGKVDVAAPGVDILSLRSAGTYMGYPVGTGYTRADGTSMASPHVAGVAALILAQHPSWSIEEVRQALKSASADLYPAGADTDFGAGRVSAAGSVALASVLEAKILSPADGTAITGPVSISGLARGSAFQSYRLEYGVGSAPASWTLIQDSTTPVSGGSLGVFDLGTLADGIYTIRLTAVDTSARAFVDRIRLIVDYVTITGPAAPRVPNVAAVFKPGSVVSITGKATGPSFQSFRLEWARGMAPSGGWSAAGISLTNGGAAPVAGGEIGTWDTSGIGQADYYAVRLVVDDAGFSGESRTVVYLEPDLLSPNWPKALPETPGEGSGVVPTVDASGATRLAIVVPSWANAALAPSLLTFSPDGASQTTTSLYYGAFLQPAAADFDGLAGQELIVAEANSLRVFRADGSSTVLSPSRSVNFQSALVTSQDLDGDGQLEVIASARDLTLSNTADIFAWKRNGLLMPGFPIFVGNNNGSVEGGNAPRLLVADLDSDGRKEILVVEGTTASSFKLLVYRSDGTPHPGWLAPTFNSYRPAQMAVADLDRDGSPEVVLIAVTSANSFVHVLLGDGAERPGWPLAVPNPGGTGSYLALGDLDRDGRDEIIVSNASRVYALRGDGTPLSSEWPYQPFGYYSFGTVVVGDIDGDGYPEVLVSRLLNMSSSYPQPAGADTAAHNEAVPFEWLPESTAHRETGENGTVTEARNVAPNSYPGLGWTDMRLQALDRTAREVKAWRILGGNGHQPTWWPNATLGDFDNDGTLDIALVWRGIAGNGQYGMVGSGGMTVLTTGAPYSSATSDWPSIFHDPRNTIALVRPDSAPPSVSITAPAAGTVVTGPITVSAQAADDAGVAGVRFKLDGADIGPEDISPPFAVTWDARTASIGAHTLTAVARDSAGRLSNSTPVNVVVERDTIAPSVAITSPLPAANVIGIVTVAVAASDDRAVTAVELWVDGALRATSSTPPWTLVWDATFDAPGAHSIVARAYDQALNVAVSDAVAVNLSSAVAAYDSVRRAPRCGTVANVCDSGTLLNGRNGLGPEPNQPNTINNSCGDGAGGTYHVDESNDRVRITTVDGTLMRPGKLVKVEATVWASNVFATLDHLDLFYAANAASPSWTLIKSLVMTKPGAQVFSATYTLPAGALQAVRARFSLIGDVTPCQVYNNSDHDDLVFAVGANQGPTANAGGPYTGLRNQAIAMSGSGSNDPDGDTLTYSWDFGDGTTGTGASPSHAYATSGLYTVSLVVSDGIASSASAATMVTIAPNGAPFAAAGGPYSGVRSESVSFDGSASSDPENDGLTYQWDFGDGWTGTGVSPTHAYAGLGVYSVSLVVNDGIVSSSPATATVTISNQAPVASAGGPYAAVRNQAITFDGVASSDGDRDPLTYSWDFGDGSTATGSNPSHAYAALGSYTASLVVNDGIVSSAPATATVTITNQPPVATAGGPYSGARGEAIAFDGSSSSDPEGDVLTYNWDFGDGATAAGTTPAHAYASSGVFTVRLVVSDGVASSAPATASVTITNQAPVANAGGPYSGVRNQSVSFDGSASSDPESDGLTFHWDFGDGATGGGATPNHAYSTLGTFNVTLTVNDGTVSSPVAVATVTIGNRAPVANAGSAYSGVRGQPVSFSGAASSDADGDALTYEWTFGDGAPGSAGVAPTHAYSAVGSFTATLRVHDGHEYSNAATASVAITNRLPIANAGGPYSGTRLAPIAFNGAGSSDADGDPLTYEWSFGDGATGVGPTPTHTYTQVGTFTVSLVVRDGIGPSSPSTTSVQISNVLPTVSLTAPAAGAQFAAPANITLSANASDADGTIARVEFFQGTTSLGVDTTSPYSVAWNAVAVGSYTLTARATDNLGAVVTSSSVAIKVTATLAPTADAYVRGGSSNANDNFGTATALTVQENSSSSNDRWTYLKINLASLPSITNAKLRLFGGLSATTSTTVQTAVYSVSNTSWTETGITWNNKPASGSTALATVTIVNNSTTARWYEWDVTAYLQAEKAAGRNVVTLALKNLANSSPFATFSSKEATTASNRPGVLVVP